jgi:putative ABC transport system permease protein
VTGVSATNTLPLSGGVNVVQVQFPSAPGNTGDHRDRPLVDRLFTRAGYVETMGMRVLAGRALEEGRHDGVREALIDRHLAQQFFPNGNTLGATIRCNGDSLTIVGVVDQARLYDLYRDGRPQIFVRAEDFPNVDYWFYVIRTTSDPHALVAEARAAIRQIERRIPVSLMVTMDDIVADRRSRERISAVLIAGLALGALLFGLDGSVWHDFRIRFSAARRACDTTGARSDTSPRDPPCRR